MFCELLESEAKELTRGHSETDEVPVRVGRRTRSTI